MGCSGNTLAGSLTAGPLDKKTDEETLSNKAARPCQATISPPRDGGVERQKSVEVAKERGRERWHSDNS